MSIEFVTSNKPGRLGIKTPYNADFVKELKMIVPSAKWGSDAWFFDEISKGEVERLAQKYWPPDDQLQKVRVHWTLNRDDPRVDGTSLAWIDRDHWKWKKDFPLPYRIVEVDVQSGGSRKNPGLFGKLVIELMCRPGAVFKPEPDSIEVIESGKEESALAGFSSNELIEELQARGYVLAEEQND